MEVKEYGRIPSNELEAFSIQGRNGGEYDPNNIADKVFADKLADYDDPRELYLRKDLSYRGNTDDDYRRNIQLDHSRISGNRSNVRLHVDSQNYPLLDGTSITVHPHAKNYNSPPSSYMHYWNAPGSFYGAVLSPQEHEEQLRKLGIGQQEEPEQMSRSKPIVVSYRRNSVKKYASTTVSRAMGLGDNRALHPHAVGSRLAIVLQEIKHSKYGKANQTLQKLTDAALDGSQRGQIFRGIRDELLRSNDPRSVELARQYNWHKIGEGLERDQHLSNFVNQSAKGGVHEGTGRVFRKFYNSVVHGHNMDDSTREAFFRAMHQHLKAKTGTNHSYAEMAESLRRLGDTEENIENVSRNKMGGGRKLEVLDYKTPAYRGTPPVGGVPDSRRRTPEHQLSPGQFRRPQLRIKK